MKALVFVLGLLVLCSAEPIRFWDSTPFLPNLENAFAPDPKESLQLIWNGLWEQAGLPDPVKIINCFDEKGANLTLNFIGAMLVDIARSDAVVIPKTVINYKNSISTSTVYCFGNDTELTQLRAAFNVSNVTVPQLEVEIEKYILLHLKQLTNYAASGDFYFSQGQYKQVGTVLGQVAQSVVNTSEVAEPEVIGDSLSDLQSLLNGLFEQANLPDPTTLVSCFNQTTAKITLDFYGDVINDLSNDDYLALVREYHIYASSIPQNVSECVKNSTEATSVYDAYGFNNETSKTLLQKYLSFGIKHHFQLLNDTKTINQYIGQDDYVDAGKVTGVLIQAIINPSEELISEEQITEGLTEVIEDMFSTFMNEHFPIA